MINEAALKLWQRSGPPPVCESQLIHSHLEAYAEIRRLRGALQSILGALDAVDSGEFDTAIDELVRLDRLS